MLLEAIDALINATVTVTRRERGAYDPNTGKYAPGPSSTFPADVVMQPAFGLNRVVGGADMQGRVDNQQTTTVYSFFTRTEIRTRMEPGAANVGDPGWDPDVVRYKNSDWEVARVEEWGIDAEIYYHVVITKLTGGGA